MTRTIADAELVHETVGGTATTISNDVIERVSISQRAQDRMDTGEFVLDDDGSLPTITSGDKLTFRTRLGGEASLTRQWTAMARNVTRRLEAGGQRGLRITATDFVFTVLSWRIADASFEDTDVGNIVDSLVESEAPELGRSQIDTVGVKTDAFPSGRKLLDLITSEYDALADALVTHDGTDLVFTALGNVSSKHDLTPTDLRAPIELPAPDDRLVNRHRVDGGTDHAVDDEQPTQTSTTTVTDSSRLTHQLDVRKSELARIQLWTDPKANSADSVVVRLQADDGGSPVAVGDRQSDIANKTLAVDFLSSADFTTFLLPDHTLAPGADPWLIIEATGSNGQDIGVDGSGTPTYRAEFPFPLAVRVNDFNSQTAYRRRDLRTKDETLETFVAAQDTAKSKLRHRATPERQVIGVAETDRATNLSTGEAVTLPTADWPDNVAGQYLCLERQLDFEGETNRLSADLVLQEVSSI